jgi:hypothetical protein
MSVADLKARLADVPGIETLTQQLLGGRQVFGFDGLIAAVDPLATDQEIEDAIRDTAARKAAYQAKAATPLPPVGLMPAPTTETKPMSTPAPGSFAASLRAMMDEARAGVEQARTDGLAKVKDAVGKLGEAKVAVSQVTGSMARTIEDEAASVMAELGQISNMGPE